MNLRKLDPETARAIRAVLDKYKAAILDEEKARGILPREQELLDKLP